MAKGFWDGVGGGAIGSGIGSVLLGPIGGAVGGVVGAKKGIGGVGDWFSSIDPTKVRKADTSAAQAQIGVSSGMRDQFLNSMGNAQNPNYQQVTFNGVAPGQIANAQTDESRMQQQQAMALLQAAAQGGAPSAASIQAQQQGDAAVAQMYNMAAMSSGNPAAMGNVGMNAANLNAQQISNAAALKAQEIASARQAYLQGTDAMRGADIGMATNQAQMLQQAGQFNASGNFQAQAQNQDAGFQAQQLGQQEKLAYLNAALQAQNLAQGGQAGILSMEQQRQNAISAARSGMFGSVLQTGGQVAAKAASGGAT